jgi:hypothetical protein
MTAVAISRDLSADARSALRLAIEALAGGEHDIALVSFMVVVSDLERLVALAQEDEA